MLRKKTLKVKRSATRKNIQPKTTKTGHVTATTTAAGKVVAAKADTALTKAIKTVVRGQDETKYAAQTLLDSTGSLYVAHNSVINTAGDWYRCIPITNIGNFNYARNGNQIHPISATVHWNFKFSKSDANTRDIEVNLYIVRPKFVKKYVTSDPGGQLQTNYDKFLMQQPDLSETATYFDGTWRTSIMPVDPESFTKVLHKKFRLCKPSGLFNGSGIENDGDGVASMNFPPARQFSYTFKPPTLKYDNSASTVPENFNMMWAVGYRYLDGTPPDTSSGLLYVDARTEMYFKEL